MLFQTWRAVSDPPQDNLLALLRPDFWRVEAGRTWRFVRRAVLTGRSSLLESVEAASCRYNPDHRWYYASDMGAEDAAGLPRL